MEVRVKSGACEPTGTVSMGTGIAGTILRLCGGGVKRLPGWGGPSLNGVQGGLGGTNHLGVGWKRGGGLPAGAGRSGPPGAALGYHRLVLRWSENMRIILITGKGGAGASTLAAATAVAL